ncbi:MAG TPA: DUF642 domain-containing protein [Rhizomicrobium sp.]|nr:DUF642 domain-containing protein [Rhizomicrobium sp.]
MKFSHFIAAACFLAAATPALADRIKDNSFETPALASGAQQTFNIGDMIGPWTVVGQGDVTLIGPDNTIDGLSLQAKNGAQFVNLAGDQRLKSGIEQTFRTVPGTQYILWFRVGAIVDRNQGFRQTSTVDLFVDGEARGNFSVFANADSSKVTWAKVGAVFTAESNKTTVDFFNGDGPAGGFCGLDALTMAVDQEP